MKDGKYICTTTDYRILDNNNNLIFIVATHCGLDSNDEEVNDSSDIKYCDCGNWSYV
tara:strand:+ start:366 stop:536 length:171 start_codon:yes stop_codon:yes gene_type:complete